MAVFAATTLIPARTWTLLNNPSGGSASLVLQVEGDYPVFFSARATNAAPTNDAVNAPAGELLYLPGQGERMTLANFFPDISSPLYLFGWAERPSRVAVRHA